MIIKCTNHVGDDDDDDDEDDDNDDDYYWWRFFTTKVCCDCCSLRRERHWLGGFHYQYLPLPITNNQYLWQFTDNQYFWLMTKTEIFDKSLITNTFYQSPITNTFYKSLITNDQKSISWTNQYDEYPITKNNSDKGSHRLKKNGILWKLFIKWWPPHTAFMKSLFWFFLPF